MVNLASVYCMISAPVKPVIILFIIPFSSVYDPLFYFDMTPFCFFLLSLYSFSSPTNEFTCKFQHVLQCFSFESVYITK